MVCVLPTASGCLGPPPRRDVAPYPGPLKENVIATAKPPAAPANTGGAPIDIDALIRLERRIHGRRPDVVRWLDDAHYVEYGVLPGAEKDADGKGPPRQLLRVHAESGKAKPLYDADRVEAALRTLGGLSAQDAGRLARRRDAKLLPGDSGLLLRWRTRLYSYDFASDVATRIGGKGEILGPRLAPDGESIGFVRKHDIYVAPLAGGSALRVTHDGADELLNGRLDWVYQEEIYGRGNWNGFWWSPDSSLIAFLQLDESPVSTVRLEEHTVVKGKQETWRYPKAGEPNPLVKVGVVPAAGGDVVWVKLAKYPPEDRLIVDVSWSRDGRDLLLQVTNRIQNRLDLLAVNPATGRTRRILREEPGPWVKRSPVRWLDDERFLWTSTRDGWPHLYIYNRSGKRERQLTKGQFEVQNVLRVGDDALLALTDEGNVLERHLWRIPLDGSPRKRITTGRGQHTASVSSGGALAVVSWTNAEDPGSRDLIRVADGTRVRTLGAGDRSLLESHGFIAPEFMQIKNADGFPLELAVVKPPEFRPDGQYPILFVVYGGPHAPTVRDQFGGLRALVNSELARRGYLIVGCDPRSASGKGEQSAWTMYGRAGETELADLEFALDDLIGRGWAHPERVGIFGWSYGGFMASYALTHSKRFSMGIAGAPVTDWRNYDTVYTERYMGTPQGNAAGYKRTSVVRAAKHLHGELLLLHGSMDENVHLSNTLQLANELQRAGKHFRMMIYPRNRHGITRKGQREHLQRTIADFIVEKL